MIFLFFSFNTNLYSRVTNYIYEFRDLRSKQRVSSAGECNTELPMSRVLLKSTILVCKLLIVISYLSLGSACSI